MKKGFLSCLLLSSLLPVMAQQKATLVREEMVMDKPPVPAAHASTMTELADGRLMMAWFGGSRESAKDVCIYTAIYAKGRWSAPVVVADGVVNDSTRYAAWNPVLYTNKKGELLLFYKVGPNPREWWGVMKTSKNNGKTWSKALPLPDSILGPIRNKPVLLSNGLLLHPSSTESLDEKVWNVHVEFSDIYGKNWKRVNVNCDTFGVIQPTILFHPGNKLQMLCRSRQNAIVESWSVDNGLTWSPLRKQDMLNPNSGIDAVTLKSGVHVLIYNPAVSGKDWSDGRNELRVGVSKDGEHWEDVYELEKHPKGEFSYPAVIEGKNGEIHISYTYDRKNIKHVVIRL